MALTAEVLIPPLASPYTYCVPEELSQEINIGQRVVVPLGRRSEEGYIFRLDNEGRTILDAHGQPLTLKPLQAVLDPSPHFLPEQLSFFQWAADYYGEPLSSVLDVAVPPWTPAKQERSVTLSAAGAAVDCDTLRSRLQREVLRALREAGGALPAGIINRRFKGAAAAVKKLEAAALVSVTTRELQDTHLLNDSDPDWAKREVELNADQLLSVDQVAAAAEQGMAQPFLLHGITGSGKTEVYIELIRRLAQCGKGALLIVPEIALTPQLVDRFRARVGNNIAILHSGLARRARWDAWRALLSGRSTLAIGARSAVFAPVKNLGVVIVDEEHDGSYKQSEGFRYHARDLALVRGKLQSIPVVLGSATPSLESFFHAREGRYRYISLPLRHGPSRLPEISLIDLNRVKPWEMPSKNVSPDLLARLAETIARGEQAFVLYNRRGFASYMQCVSCEGILECPHCSVTLTVHRKSNALLCHYCNFTMAVPRFCGSCKSKPNAPTDENFGTYTERGAGTERIFEELQQLLPGAAIDRLDRDAASDLTAYRKVLGRVRSGETQVLVGTQMIAKGHDLPNVTLVGIADCDVGLHMPDFRAAERTFQLLTQASGRAGRGALPGTVVLQTRVPKHPSLIATCQHSYQQFAEQQLQMRKAMRYPPYLRLLRIVASSSDPDLPLLILQQLADHLRAASALAGDRELLVTGPAPAPLERLKTMWRAHLIVRSSSAAALNRAMYSARRAAGSSKKVRVIFDLDPQEMM